MRRSTWESTPGTPVSLIEYHYDCPFKFTGKIDRLTVTLGPAEFVAEKKE